jgi:hypothetical protein
MLTNIEKYKEKIKNAIAQKDNEFGNNILYKMCKENPKHDNPDVVSGKVWLIGRSYAADIARGKDGAINDDFYKSEVGEILSKVEVDQKIFPLKKYYAIQRENIKEILEVHKFLLDKIANLPSVKNGKKPQKHSFCSKYLHFHLPELFFIYDSRVVGTLQKLYPGRLKGFNDVFNGDIDETYATFFCKAFVLKNEIKEKLDLKITPRQVDNFLINEANGNLRNKKS